MKNLLKKLIIPALMVLAIVCAAPMASAADYPFTYEVGENGVSIISCNVDFEGEIVIPDKIDGVAVTTIKAAAFSGAEGVTAITLPSGLITIDESAFEGCTSIKKIVIPDSVVAVGENAFASCASLTDLTIGKGLTKISKGMFEGCTSLSSVVLHKNIAEIDDYAFSCCDSLKDIIIYPYVTSMGNYVFYDCDSLEKIALPETITVVGEGLFGDCNNLKSISLQDTVTTIEVLAFENCTSISEVYYTGSLAKWSQISVGEEGNDSIYNGTVYYKHAHEYEKVTLIDATCDKAGTANFSCVCGYTYIGQVPALGHERVVIPGVDVTCTENGKTEGEKCSRCGVILTNQVTIPATGHLSVVDEAVEATCTSEGKTKGSHCETCGEVFVKQEIVKKKPHNNLNEVTKATLSKNGRKISTCKDCGHVENKVLYNVSQITVTSAYVYTGKTITPTVTVKDSEGNMLIKDTDYTVTYSGTRKEIGKYTLKVTLKGDYSGNKTLSYSITADKTASIKRTSATNGTMKLTWSKVAGATGYYVYIYNKTSDTKNPKRLATVTGTTYTITKDYNGKALTVGKDYKIAVRAFTKLSDGSILYAKSGVAKTFKLYPATPTLKMTTTKGKVNFTWNNVAGEKGYQIWYSTSKDGTYKKLSNYDANKTSASAKFTSGTTYYFKIRSYTYVDNKLVHGSYSAVQSIKVK